MVVWSVRMVKVAGNGATLVKAGISFTTSILYNPRMEQGLISFLLQLVKKKKKKKKNSPSRF